MRPRRHVYGDGQPLKLIVRPRDRLAAQRQMPYFIIAFAFILFTIGASIATLCAKIIAPLGPLFAYAWRGWLWSTVGFLVANALMLGAIWITIEVSDRISTDSLRRVFQVAVAGSLILGPFAASVAGLVCGGFLGCFLAWRASRRAPSTAV